MYYIELGEVLKKKEKSRYWLHNKTGITFQTIRKLEKNETSRIEFETLAKICIALDCSPNDIIKIDRNVRLEGTAI